MIKLLSILGLLVCLFLLVSAPYYAAIYYTFVSLLQPQYVWGWAFGSFPIFKLTAGLTIIAWILSAFRGQVGWGIYKSGIMYAMICLFIIFYLSEFFSPFQSYNSVVSSDLVIGIFSTITIMFIVVLGCISNKKGLKLGIIAIVATALYYSYWSNSAYFSGEWFRFEMGRLTGPEGSPYKDGNVASVLLVIGMPFIILALYEIKTTWKKVLLICTIPFLLHTIILFASRGALLSIGVSMIVVAFMIRSKAFNFVLAVGALAFLIDQGGQLIYRTTSTISAAQAEREAPIDPRILSWQVGSQMALKYPLFGVGPQRFLEASRMLFPGKTPYVAHNTFLNFSANTGLIAGFCYLSFFYISRKYYKQNLSTLQKKPDKLLSYANRASYAAMIGFFTASMFLDLIIFEPFYFLLIIVIVTHYLTQRSLVDNGITAKQ